MKWQDLIYVVLGIIILSPVVFIYNGIETIWEYPGTPLGIMIMLFGVLNLIQPKNSEPDAVRGQTKSQSIAHDISVIPGMGHIYLRRYKIGFVMLGLFALSILLVAAPIFNPASDSYA